MVFRVLRSWGPASQSKEPPPLARKRSSSSPVPRGKPVQPRLKGKMEEADLQNLNKELRILAQIFPDVRPEVFREMLGTFSDESRMHVVAEQLVKHNVQWVNGRRRTSTDETSSGIMKDVFEIGQTTTDDDATNDHSTALVPLEETFRSPAYQRAARTALAQEFKSLSRSTIDGVLAEQNYSYTLSRPILMGLAAKSWRLSFASLLSKWKRSNNPSNNQHHMLIWPRTTTQSSNPLIGVELPSLRPTGSEDLDKELEATVLQPLLAQRREAHDRISAELAQLLNEEEAGNADALYECECCFSDMTFESMATCSEGRHMMCFRCIQASASEALYGQSWNLNIDHGRGQMACLAPSDPQCKGCIPQDLAQRAILQTRGGDKTWAKLQSRLADEALRVSGAKVVSCPFCTYAEADDVWLPPGALRWRLNVQRRPVLSLLYLAVGMVAICMFWWQYAFLSLFFPARLPPPLSLLRHAFAGLLRQTHLPQRFVCRNPTCGRPSCRTCRAPWRDVHGCWESERTGLRKAVEAARTAALKRTCPVCGVGFVKESGCNKMVCVCGYSMCYVCRQGLGRKPPAGAGPAAPVAAEDREAAAEARERLGGGLGLLRWVGMGGDGEEDGEGRADDAVPAEGEGYRHFCQHFRPAGGRCASCEKCDLYRSEDGDEIVRRAGLRAEKEWRRQQANRDGEGKRGEEKPGFIQGVVDGWVRMVVRC